MSVETELETQQVPPMPTIGKELRMWLEEYGDTPIQLEDLYTTEGWRVSTWHASMAHPDTFAHHVNVVGEKKIIPNELEYSELSAVIESNREGERVKADKTE